MKLAKSKKPQLWVFDTEDNSRGKLYQIIFYNGDSYVRFTNCADALAWMETFKATRVVCFAVNLEYDIINIFRGKYDRLRWMFGKSKLISCRYKNFTFYDTLNHWKMSVDEMGKRVGLHKHKFDPKSIKYCKRDCKVTYNFVKYMVDIYDKIGFRLKSTLPSTVYNYWLNNYAPFKLKRIEGGLLDTYKKAYYGGRNDCFHIGKFIGRVYCVDVNSLYPFVMQSEYPSPYVMEKRYSPQEYGISKVRVSVDQKIPVLPYRTRSGKLIYPNGDFTGFWSNHELQYAKSQGGFKILKVYDSYTFPITCFPFQEFVSDFYDRRMSAPDELWSLTYKIAMNSLYGKFGQGKERTNVISYREYVKNKKKLGTDNISIFDNIVIYVTEEDYPINTNMIWALYTTSYARIYLHTHLKRIADNGGKLLYCDTDSIFYSANRHIIECSNTLGGWKDDGIYRGIEIKLPKMYRLLRRGDNKIRTKGVPRAKQDIYFDRGCATFKRPVKFKEGLRRGIMPNLWMDYRKQNQLKYDKGHVDRTGKVSPFYVDL